MGRTHKTIREIESIPSRSERTRSPRPARTSAPVSSATAGAATSASGTCTGTSRHCAGLSTSSRWANRTASSASGVAHKRLANLEAVVGRAAVNLGDKEVPETEPDHDWAARFFAEVQDVSSEEMQVPIAAHPN